MVVEENSPAIKPESDELWAGLIERDFPDRPSHSKRNLIAGETEQMPNKTLYDQYTEEREQLRASTAERLRNLTQKLQKEKSKNSIVPIQGIMKEPTIRRIPAMSLAPAHYSKYGSKSILGKAMKDMQHRQLMFRSTQKSDPFKAFRNQKREVPLKRLAEPQPPSLIVRQEGPTSIYLKRPVGQSTSLSQRRQIPGASDVVLSSKSISSSSFETSPIPESRKRKATSVFISSKRMPRAPRIPLELRPKRDVQTTSPPIPEKPGPRKPVRSSIFH